MDQVDPNPRTARRRSSAELARAVRNGRQLAEAMRTLGRSGEIDEGDRELARELARVLVRRADTRHDGWKYLRRALLRAGAEARWARCERQAIGPTAERVLADCAGAGHSSLVRLQHIAAQELARALAAGTDQAAILPRLLKGFSGPAGDEDWERALVAAVTARSEQRATDLIAVALGSGRPEPGGG